MTPLGFGSAGFSNDATSSRRHRAFRGAAAMTGFRIPLAYTSPFEVILPVAEWPMEALCQELNMKISDHR
jgi:hypothetical protein